MTEHTMRRHIPFPRVFNFRDVGGYRTSDGQTVRWRRMFRSDSLSGLDEGDRDQFLGLGVRTVLDLRRDYEIDRMGRVPAWDGLRYLSLDPGHREWDHAPYQDGLDPARYLADRYRDMAEEGAPRLAEAIGHIANEAGSPLVVHCVAGKDRTGVVCALTLALLGVSDDDIDADYVRSTTNNERYVAWARANGSPDLVMQSWWRSPPGTMRLFLSELRQRHGSVARYLTWAGLDREHFAALRAELLS